MKKTKLEETALAVAQCEGFGSWAELEEYANNYKGAVDMYRFYLAKLTTLYIKVHSQPPSFDQNTFKTIQDFPDNGNGERRVWIDELSEVSPEVYAKIAARMTARLHTGQSPLAYEREYLNLPVPEEDNTERAYKPEEVKVYLDGVLLPGVVSMEYNGKTHTSEQQPGIKKDDYTQ